ncbi:MAG: Dolichol-phosphate mannosyltransferase [Labilithrix sp.]|nr:Dolichol-phosphate mannosyltransferase [Labilithrix sp.]
MRIAVLMPAFNEEGRLARTLEELASCLAASAASEPSVSATVFLVDDGSTPPIAGAAVAAAAGPVRVVLARHAINLGQGAALETARRLALEPTWAPAGGPFEAFVTMDSDGQHQPSDVLRLARAVTSGADVALGDRFGGGSDVPTSRRVLLHMARGFEWLTTGQLLSDVHNGLRAFAPRAMANLQIRQNRMAHASEITRSISRAQARAKLGGGEPLRVIEVPVSVRYTGESLAKGQRASGALAIVVDLFQGFLFGSSSR